MGGWNGPILNESAGIPGDLAGQMRRRGLIPALAQVQPAQPAGTDRVQDDPVTRANPEAYGATTPAQSPVSASPSNPLTEKMWEEYNRLGQPEPAPPQPSLKQRLLQGILRAAPIAAGAAFGGAYGAGGAAQGEVQGLQNQQRVRLAQQQMAQQHEQQRTGLREHILQQIMQQQDREAQMQQRGDLARQHDELMRALTTQRGANAMDVQTLKGEQGSALQTQKAGDASSLAAQKADAKTPSEWEVFMSGEQGKTPQQIVQDYAKFRQPPQRIGITFVGPDGTVGRAAPGQQIPQGATTPGAAMQQGQITPATQTILQSTQPARQMVDGLLADLDAASAQGRGNDRLTMSRIGYALGQSSPDGNLAKDISGLELNRVMSAARILKGSSRAYQALERAMVHTPNPWVDTVDLMRDKLRTIQKALADTEQDAIAFGTKGQSAAQATERVGNLGAGPRPGTVEDGYRFKGGDPADKSNWELAKPR